MRNLLGVPRQSHYGNLSAVDIRAAEIVGGSTQPKTVHQWRLSTTQVRPVTKVAAILRAALEAGDDEAFAREWAPIEAALQSYEPATLSPELRHRAQRADLEEDLAENDYRLDPSESNLKRWLRALRRQGTLTWKLLTAER